LLLAELRWLLKNGRPLAPRQVLDAANFARHRTKILQMLIQRFEQPGGGQSGGEQGFPRIAEG
jgi:hypothetical protein